MQIDEHVISMPAELVTELVVSAWDLVVGEGAFPVDEIPDERLDERLAMGDSVDASISIGGPWRASMILRCSRSAAFAAASHVLGLPAADLGEADVHDVMGEMANIVGGNLKGVVSGDGDGWTLSLPVVSNGPQRIPGSRRLVVVDLEWRGEPLRCELREIA